MEEGDEVALIAVTVVLVDALGTVYVIRRLPALGVVVLVVVILLARG